ncbi:MAG TPA: class I SAM-dependent methyltransferase [Candidatus Nitrosopolaris sp.]|nr:class I SAM-dependent methyltransferase [Candidatus Nitrosopolaris sp.]
MSSKHWEEHANDWAAWARRPDFDSYWLYARHFFELLPSAGARTLEVGCGEGRVSRDLAARGHRVTAVDTSPTLIQLACDAGGSIAYARCDAAALPFQDQTFDLIVFYNSLMDFDDMEASIAEAGRVLRSGGFLCASITHPLQDAGKFDSPSGDARFIIEGSYLGERRAFDAQVERDGYAMHFKGWAYPLETYMRAQEKAGLMIQAIREPRLDSTPPSLDPGGERWRRIPLFLMWRAVKA